MKPTNDYSAAHAYTNGPDRPGDVPPGGYICKIVQAIESSFERTGLPCIKVAIEIAEGEYAGRAREQWQYAKEFRPDAVWPMMLTQATLNKEGGTNPYFKGLISSIEASNANYKWDWDERKLAGKMIGIVFREEDYYNKDGELKTNTRPFYACDVLKIRTGVPIPPKKPVRTAAPAPTAPIAAESLGAPVDYVDDELPF